MAASRRTQIVPLLSVTKGEDAIAAGYGRHLIRRALAKTIDGRAVHLRDDVGARLVEDSGCLMRY